MAPPLIKSPVTVDQIRAERELDLVSYEKVARLENKNPQEVMEMLPATCDEKERGKILSDFRQMVEDGKVDWDSKDSEELDVLGYRDPATCVVTLPLQWKPHDISEYFAEKSTPACNPGFEKEDRTAYFTEKSLREIESDQKARTKAFRNYAITADLTHPFIKAYKKFPYRFINSLQSTQVYGKLANRIQKEYPQIIRDGHLVALVPAAGSRLSSLYAGLLLIDRKKIKDAEFIFTEVNSDYLKRIDHQFLLLEKEGIIQDYQVTSQTFAEGKEGDEIYFKFNYQGKPVQLTFALNRSGEKFWREEYSQRANLVIFDDADEDKIPEFVEELREQKRVDPTTRSKVILVEGRNTISVSESIGKLHYTPPSSLRYEEIKGQYGHCTGHYGLVGRNGKVWNIENNSCHHKSGVLISIF